MVFEHHLKVRMYDTDMAQILFFGNQYRFMHDALEELLAVEGLTMDKIFRELGYGFVIVHSEADYLAALRVGDAIKITVTVDHIGTSSFSFNYTLYRQDKRVGTGKTVHVVIDNKTHQKQVIPESLRQSLEKYVDSDR